MARNRMIKPEFWDDEKLAVNTSRDARFIYIGLWNLSDDYGVVKGNPIWLMKHLLPYEGSLSPQEFSGWLSELEKIECILPFSSGGENFYFIRKFKDHQRINRPSGQRNPKPPDEFFTNYNEHSRSTHGVINEHSHPTQGALIDEKKRKEVKRNKNNPASEQVFSENKFDHQNSVSQNTPSGVSFENKNQPSHHKSEQVFNKKQPDPNNNNKPVFDKNRKNGSGCAEYFAGINKACDMIANLPPKSRQFNPQQWAQVSINSRAHPGAVMETLEGLSIFWDSAEDPWAVCQKILKTKNGNWNEKEAIAIHQELKDMGPGKLEFFTNGLLKEIA